MASSASKPPSKPVQARKGILFTGLQTNKAMEHTGLEPVTSTLPVWRAPNCANAPYGQYSTEVKK